MNKRRGNPNFLKKQTIDNTIKQEVENTTNVVNNTAVQEPVRPPNRKPLFSRIRLKYPKVIVKDGVRYRTHVFNDKDDRIIRAEEAGYTRVLKSDMPGRDDRCGAPSQLGEPVVTPVGRGINGVLMMIPEVWYEEDQEARKKYLDEREIDIMKPSPTAGYGKVTIEVEN